MATAAAAAAATAGVGLTAMVWNDERRLVAAEGDVGGCSASSGGISTSEGMLECGRCLIELPAPAFLLPALRNHPEPQRPCVAICAEHTHHPWNIGRPILIGSAFAIFQLQASLRTNFGNNCDEFPYPSTLISSVFIYLSLRVPDTTVAGNSTYSKFPE